MVIAASTIWSAACHPSPDLESASSLDGTVLLGTTGGGLDAAPAVMSESAFLDIMSAWTDAEPLSSMSGSMSAVVVDEVSGVSFNWDSVLPLASKRPQGYAVDTNCREAVYYAVSHQFPDHHISILNSNIAKLDTIPRSSIFSCSEGCECVFKDICT